MGGLVSSMEQHPIVLRATHYLNLGLTCVEQYGWYIVLLSALTYFAYRYIAREHHHQQIYAPARVESLTEQMRLQRLRQQAAWSENAKTVVAQSKSATNGGSQQQKKKKPKKAQNPYNHQIDEDSDESSDDEASELSQIFRDTLAKKDKAADAWHGKSGMSSSAFNRGTGSSVQDAHARNRFSSSRAESMPMRGGG